MPSEFLAEIEAANAAAAAPQNSSVSETPDTTSGTETAPDTSATGADIGAQQTDAPADPAEGSESIAADSQTASEAKPEIAQAVALAPEIETALAQVGGVEGLNKLLSLLKPELETAGSVEALVEKANAARTQNEETRRTQEAETFRTQLLADTEKGLVTKAEGQIHKDMAAAGWDYNADPAAYAEKFNEVKAERLADAAFNEQKSMAQEVTLARYERRENAAKALLAGDAKYADPILVGSIVRDPNASPETVAQIAAASHRHTESVVAPILREAEQLRAQFEEFKANVDTQIKAAEQRGRDLAAKHLAETQEHIAPEGAGGSEDPGAATDGFKFDNRSWKDLIPGLARR